MTRMDDAAIREAVERAGIRSCGCPFTVPEIAAEALARGEECERLRAEVERLTRERDDANAEVEARAEQLAYSERGKRDAIARAESAEIEVARLRAEAIPADAEERVAAKLAELERGDDPEGCETWSEDEMVRWIARQLLAAIRRQA